MPGSCIFLSLCVCFGCQARVGCVFSGLCPLGLGTGLRSCRLHVPDSLCGCGSLAKSCLTLGVPMDCSPPVSPVLYYLPEVAEIHVRWVGDTI